MSKPIEIHTNLFVRLKEHGFKLTHAIDIGCHKGKWSERLLKTYPEAKILLIDASDKYADDLNKLGTFKCAAVGQENEEKTFYYSDNEMDESGNSLYKENSNTPFKRKRIETKKLSEIVDSDTVYQLIKMDIQGAELEVIEGSLDLFSKTKFVQLECAVFKNNIGAPNFEQIVNYMANTGFKVFDIENIFWNGKLMGIDFLFVNQNMPKEFSLEAERMTYQHHGN